MRNSEILGENIVTKLFWINSILSRGSFLGLQINTYHWGLDLANTMNDQ